MEQLGQGQCYQLLELRPDLRIFFFGKWALQHSHESRYTILRQPGTYKKRHDQIPGKALGNKAPRTPPKE